MPRMQIHIAIAVFLISGLLAVTGCTKEKNLAPVPGDGGVISVESVTHNSVIVKWRRATDDNTNYEFIDYQVVYAKYDPVWHRDDISDLASAEKNGIKAPIYISVADSEEPEKSYWNKSIESIQIKDLEDGKLYYFNVIARDRQWLRTAYQMASKKTVDITAPVPGNAGLVSTIGEKEELDGTVSLNIKWAKATDNNSSGDSVLEYRVVRSILPNVSTQNGIEENDQTPAAERIWSRDINLYPISNLEKGTLYYFNVLVKDELGNTGIYAMTSQTPSAGDNGTLFISNEEQDGLTLNWAKATDGDNDQGGIQYRVVRSTLDNISTIESAELLDETPSVDQLWHNDIQSLKISGLTQNKIYFFNVIAQDITGFKVIYKAISNAPKPGGSISISDKQPTSLTLSWPKATDSGSDEATLSYWVVFSESSNLDTLENTLNNGIPIQGWTTNISTIKKDGLAADKDYFFNIVVKDTTGHMAVYGMASCYAESRKPKSSSALERTAASLADGGTIAPFPAPISRTESDQLDVDMNTPLNIDSGKGHLVAWFDGADPAGNSAIAHGAIAEWKDKSGQENHAEQTMADKRPTAGMTQALNGRSSVHFDADQANHMVIPLGADISLQEQLSTYTVFLVAHNLAFNSLHSRAFLFDGKDEYGNQSGLMYQSEAGKNTFAVRTDQDYSFHADVPAGPFIAAFILGRSTADKSHCSLAVNNRVYELTTDSLVHPKAITRMLIGGGWEAGGHAPVVSNFMQGDLDEVIIFDRKLTSDEYQLVHAYLKGKWKID